MPNEPVPRRILIVHWDGAGNQPPQRALARALVRRGHEVHVLTGDSVAADSRSDGAVVHLFATARQFSSEQQRSPEEETHFIMTEVWGSAAVAADFSAIVEEVRPDLCLIDCMLVSILSASRARGIPTGVLFHSVYAGFDQLIDPLMEKLMGAAQKTSYSRFLETLGSVLVFSYPAFNSLQVRSVRPSCRPDSRARRKCSLAATTSGSSLHSRELEHQLSEPVSGFEADMRSALVAAGRGIDNHRAEHAGAPILSRRWRRTAIFCSARSPLLPPPIS